MFNIEDYDYPLPDDLIAQVPTSGRDRSRLLVVDRLSESHRDHLFLDLPELLRPGDLLVVNNTRVIPARLFGRKASGGQVEVLVLESSSRDGTAPPNSRWCLTKASKRPKVGSFLIFENNVSARVEELGEEGLARLNFHGLPTVDAFLEKAGAMPLPPYIKREQNDPRSRLDRERYQTIFSSEEGAVAAPTAGLHFSESLVERLKRSRIGFAEITLHVGHGTFRPVRSMDIRDHKLGTEL
jgi:S-adenosylmethionine:tRNA ribosyltransferase-isomerase